MRLRNRVGHAGYLGPPPRDRCQTSTWSSIAVTIFDSTVAVGHAEAVYFEARAHGASEADIPEALSALNARLPEGKKLSTDDFGPAGAMTLYKADIARRFILVRGGDPEQKNTLDMTLEV